MTGDGTREHPIEKLLAGARGGNGSLADGNGHDPDTVETEEWVEALEAVLYMSGRDRAQYLLEKLGQRAERGGVQVPFPANTPYVNTIPPDQEPAFPGNRDLERV